MKTRKTTIANRRLAPAAGYVGKAVWHRCQPDQLVRVGNRMKWTYEREDVQVEVMAQVGKYLMIRRPGCGPFVATTKDVTFTPHTSRLRHRRLPPAAS